MSTTLYSHPPHQQSELEAPRLTSRRPNALDKLALRVGLLLITYGRRTYAVTREEIARRAEHVRARREREAGWQRARHTLLPPR